jgi:hypothetical protein
MVAVAARPRGRRKEGTTHEREDKWEGCGEETVPMTKVVGSNDAARMTTSSDMSTGQINMFAVIHNF